MKEVISDTTVKTEFDKSTEKLHVVVTWLGVSLNILWVISDYFIVREFLLQFLIVRLIVSVSSALLLSFRKHLGISIYACLFFLVLGISIQNSYMWSVMDLEHFQKHAFAYIVLFIGVGMLVLWDLKFSLLLLLGTVLSNILFYILNSRLTLEEFFINGGLLTMTVVIFSIFLIRSRHRLQYNDIRIRLELQASKKLIENKQSEIIDSINYAKSIQRALIPSKAKFNSQFRDSFILLKPKDIVSGDFYWVFCRDEFIFYVTADCTGHGVPGGFMTVLGLSFLDQIIAGEKVNDPSAVLNIMRDKIINALNQSNRILESKDGMDISICRINKNTNELVFSAANSDLYVIQKNSAGDKSLIILKGNNQPCGQHILNEPFTSQILKLNKGDSIYSFTDGYADQFGGPKGKKFRYKQFQQMLMQNSHLKFSEQKSVLDRAIIEWRGSQDQVDDILVIGILI